MKSSIVCLVVVGLVGTISGPVAAQSARVSVKLGNQAAPGRIRVRNEAGQVGPWRATDGNGVYVLSNCTTNMEVNASLQSALGSIDGPQWRNCNSNPDFRFNSFLMAGIVGMGALPEGGAQLAQMDAAGVYADAARAQSRLVSHFKDGQAADVSVEAMELAELYFRAGLTTEADAYEALAVEAGTVALAAETGASLDAPAIERTTDGSFTDSSAAREVLATYRRQQGENGDRSARWDSDAFADIEEIAVQRAQTEKADPQ